MMRLPALMLLLSAVALAACGGQPEPPPSPPAAAQAVQAPPPEPEPPPPPEPAVPPQFEAGTQPPYGGASPEPQPPPPAEVPYDQAFPPPEGSPPVRIAILSSPSRPEDGARLALVLGTYQRERLERELGREVKIAFVSRSASEHQKRSVVHYREGNLKAATAVAASIPAGQVVAPMTPEEAGQEGVDVFVYVGTDLR